MREALLDLRPRSLGLSAQSCTPQKLLFPEGGRWCLCFRCSRMWWRRGAALRVRAWLRGWLRVLVTSAQCRLPTIDRESNSHLLPSRYGASALVPKHVLDLVQPQRPRAQQVQQSQRPPKWNSRARAAEQTNQDFCAFIEFYSKFKNI